MTKSFSSPVNKATSYLLAAAATLFVPFLIAHALFAVPALVSFVMKFNALVLAFVLVLVSCYETFVATTEIEVRTMVMSALFTLGAAAAAVTYAALCLNGFVF
ncbi:hypothetical protein [Rhizobium sp. Rhizsp82]|jgi:hypothetical protein|uniref:hypothetical protein n=1 Tax=Rhizobium sp. Rhizsp82 TaxID=3243057 RepID=UPI0039B54978